MTNRIRSISLLGLFLAVSPLIALGQSCSKATCTASSCAQSAVLAALPSSSNANPNVTVNIPSGTCSWSSGINYVIPSAVTTLTIQGATTVNCTGTPGSSSYACTAADGTSIADNYNSNTPLFYIITGGNSTKFRMTGLTLTGGTATLPKYGSIQIGGNSSNVRVDHSHFTIAGYSSSVVGAWIRIIGQNAGVLDHNLVDDGPNTGDSWNGFQAFNPIGDTVGNGDGTFQNRTPWGTSNFIYMEDNVFNGGYADDCASAGLLVMRYNYFYGMTVAVQTHGTKSPAGPARGCRAYEFYHNYIAAGENEQDAMTGTKGTTALIWGNTMQTGAAYRFWAGATDREAGDETETNPSSGWGYCGTSTNSNGIGSAWDGNDSTSTGYPCLDGVGRGQTTQKLNGADFPNRLNSVTGRISWPNQYLEPVYLFMNTLNGATEVNIRDSGTSQNVDIFADSSSFNGTTGTGYGLLANRPSTCTPGRGGTYYSSPTGSYGVAYWATDANSGNGELYVCTATNIWTGIYKPYTYPHPLETSGGTTGSPGSPTGLTGTAK